MAYTKFLHVFSTKQEHDTARSYGEGGEYHEPWVAYVNDNSKLVTYNKGWSEKYLTFKALQGGTFKFSGNKINYSVDGGETWAELAADTNTPTVSAGGTIMFKAALTPTTTGIGKFSSSGKYEAMGNPYSLLYGDAFESVRDLTGKNRVLFRLFSDSTGLTSVENLSLPATTLAEGCYNNMFGGCTSLTAAPALPATTLAYYCYSYMFLGCTSLTAAPGLPATTLAEGCCESMFSGCTSLTTAPELPATTLANSCYNGMFSDTRVLPDTSNIDFTSQSVVSSSGLTGLFGKTIVTDSDLQRILPKNSQNKYCLPVTTLASGCYRYMFQGCTLLTTAPELPATTLASGCYSYMFSGCTSLNYIKAMFTTKPSSTYTSNWVKGVASSGTFVKNSAATWNVTGVNGIPTGWTVQEASA